MKTHSDSGDYTFEYPSSIRYVPAEPVRRFDIADDVQTRMDALEERIRHLEKIVHLMINPEEA
jgi:hypothetical protein